MNYIKDIQLKNNNSYNVIVEIPKGTKNKYELDEKTFDKVIMLDDSYKVDGKKLEKIIKQILKFLSIYKGKNADMIIDKNYYGIKESLEIIDKAHNEYLNKNKANGIKVIFN